MIYSLTGELQASEPGFCVISCAGVGFMCTISGTTQRSLPPVGQTVSLLTHLNVTQDAFTLFGFATKAEKTCFRMLTGVSGVGAKTAVAVLSVLSPEQLAMSISAEDVKALTAAPGIGPKQAQRIVLELKDKIAGVGMSFSSAMPGAALPSVPAGAGGEAIKALVALGYSQTEAVSMVARLEPGLTVEQMIGKALREAAPK